MYSGKLYFRFSLIMSKLRNKTLQVGHNLIAQSTVKILDKLNNANNMIFD